MSVTGNQSTTAQTTPGGSVEFSTSNKVGFVLAILLGIANMISVANPTPEGEVGPPLPILALGALLGLVVIIAVSVGWARRNRAAIRAAAAALILSALLALPAFSTPDVPAVLKTLAAVFILLTIVTLVLMLTPARRTTAP
jgi:hypothetical protein